MPPKTIKLEARAKQDYRMGSVLAFSGVEYSTAEWRPVPAGFEEQAKSHPLLDVRNVGSTQEETTTMARSKPVMKEEADSIVIQQPITEDKKFSKKPPPNKFGAME